MSLTASPEICLNILKESEIMKSNLLKREDLTPICPYCETELKDIYYQEKGPGFLASKTVVYFCPHCNKVLGVARSNMG